ncbi:hypothetical protein BDM02DRAFT_3271223 [Thelephora ganbajun]|uniref:Uncharacterized protein n=1 Tax=Thelephora ganbajun TaxID=370292 RepID=A0ACB6Z9U9_THEGA|nr:hypothetical protein BDM02DRAFT_3271223 [Thelephora ganbajun]
MATQDTFADIETVKANVRSNIVERLKSIISGLNDECGVSISKTGKKGELIERITRQFDSWRLAKNEAAFTRAKAIVNRVTYGVGSRYGSSSSGGLFVINQIPQPSTATSNHPYNTPNPGPSVVNRHAGPYRTSGGSYQSSSLPQAPKPIMKFQPSPFLRIDQAVSNIEECPESTSSVDRKQAGLTFTLTPEQRQKLDSTMSKYQLRLYCTSSTFYSSIFQIPRGPCQMEFPPACEVRVNNMQMQANLKGLKKKPGTTPPPDLGRLVKMSPGAANRLDMIYVNSQQPVHGKKYYIIVMLVEVTSIGELIDRLKKGKFVSKEDVLAERKQSVADDDEIVAGEQKMSLKCPLSYARINLPARSKRCVHPQCFDATSWYSMMEQTTTWLCPICEKVLEPEELILDGYFSDILGSTPDTVEDVIVEADGQWHTDDNKYGSAEWMATHPPKAEPAKAAPVRPQPRTDDSRGPNQGAIVVSDDEDDEGRVKRELSPSYDPGTSNSNTQHSTPGAGTQAVRAVIDLTLSDDEDDPPAPVPPKRKSRDSHSPTEPVWKKSRYGEPGTPNGPITAPPTMTGPDTTSWRTLPPIPANRGVSRTPAGPRHTSYNSGSGSYRNPPATRW